MTSLVDMFAVLELGDGQKISFQVTKYAVRKATIKTTTEPGGKEITVLRVHVRPQDKPEFPQYWDITAKGIIGQMEGLLISGAYRGKTFTITKHGVKPTAKFTVSIT